MFWTSSGYLLLFIQSLAHELSDAERVLIEHTAILDVRVRALSWGQHNEADAVTLILVKFLGELHKMRPRP